MKSKVLSSLLAEKREKLGKTRKEVSAMLGCGPVQYGRWEATGALPRHPAHQENLATFLGLTKAQLLEKIFAKQSSVLQLIRTISQCKLTAISIADIEFLSATQASLNQSMSAELIEELMKRRDCKP